MGSCSGTRTSRAESGWSLWRAAALAAACCAAGTWAAGAAEVAPKVLAFYYTWYGTPEHQGGWRHWNEGGHDPAAALPSGLPDTGTTQHPLAGLYDSHDPATIRRHLAEAREMGIDALIATWWGQGDYHDRALERVLAEIEATASPVRACAYLEVAKDRSVAGAADDLLYILRRYGGRPGHLQHDGKPVVFVYGRAMGSLSADQWKEVVAQVRAAVPCFLVADGASGELAGLFGGNHWYNPVGMVVGGADMEAAYRDFTAQARQAGALAVTTVIPGYNDGNIGRATVIDAPRQDGQLYCRLWAAALKARPDWVAITSFNEWHEGSEVEPSTEHGRAYAELTALYSRFFHEQKDLRAIGPGVDPVELGLEGDLDLIRLTSLPGNCYRAENLDVVSHRVRATAADAAAAVQLLEERVVQAPDGVRTRPFALGLPAPLASAPDGIGVAVELPALGVLLAGPPESLSALPAEGILGEASVQAMLRRGLAVGLDSRWREGALHRGFPGQECVLEVRLVNAGLRTVDRATWALAMSEVAGVTVEKASATAEIVFPGEGRRGEFKLPIPGVVTPGVEWAGQLELTVEQAGATDTWAGPVRIRIEPPFDWELQGGPEEGIAGVKILIRKRFPGLALPGIAVMPNAPRPLFPTGTVAALSVGAEEDERELVFPLSTEPQMATLAPPVRAEIRLRWGDYETMAAGTVFIGLVMGERMAEYGLRWVEVPDGRAAVEPNLHRALPAETGPTRYLYFDAAADFAPLGKTLLMLDYMDDAQGTVTVQYDSADLALADRQGAYKAGPSFELTGTGTRKQFRCVLPDASFRSRQNGGADFRLVTNVPLALYRIAVRKW